MASTPTLAWTLGTQTHVLKLLAVIRILLKHDIECATLFADCLPTLCYVLSHSTTLALCCMGESSLTCLGTLADLLIVSCTQDRERDAHDTNPTTPALMFMQHCKCSLPLLGQRRRG